MKRRTRGAAGVKAWDPDPAKRSYGNGVTTVSASIKDINALTTVTLNPPNPGDPKRRRETKPEPCGGGRTSTLTHVPGSDLRCTNDKIYGTKLSACDYKKRWKTRGDQERMSKMVTEVQGERGWGDREVTRERVGKTKRGEGATRLGLS